MNTSNLMLKDWVMHENRYSRVNLIASSWVHLEDEPQGYKVFKDEIHPIKLTHEMLIANNWYFDEMLKEYQHRDYGGFGISIEIDGEVVQKGFESIDVEWLCYYCENVNDLQDALRVNGAVELADAFDPTLKSEDNN